MPGVTADGIDADHVTLIRDLGLALGADDFVTKPFAWYELLGRIRAVLAR